MDTTARNYNSSGPRAVDATPSVNVADQPSLSQLFERAQKLYFDIDRSELSCSCADYQVHESVFVHRSTPDLRAPGSPTERLQRERNRRRHQLHRPEASTATAAFATFLLIDYYLGSLSLKRTTLSQPQPQPPSSAQSEPPPSPPSTRTRIAIIKDGLNYLDAFAAALELHEFSGSSILPTAMVVADGAVITPAGSGVAAARRADAIARFKRQKALRERLAALRAAALANVSSEGGDFDDLEPRDDETYREIMYITLELSAQTANDEARAARDELAMLERVAEAADAVGDGRFVNSGRDGRGSTPSDPKGGYSERLDDLTALRIAQGSGSTRELLSKDGKPRRPFLITNSKREEFQKGVFRPGHILPTMTVDEFLANEFARGNIISGGGKVPEKKEPDTDGNEALEEAETLKARAWDDFKDANPKGWGNRMNKG
ncbi:hypothetical protein HDU82_005732 [Entophlyctis luteolus]|nr:hypothetical protein HDU82_005732 [Entophlyctis luteolus]